VDVTVRWRLADVVFGLCVGLASAVSSALVVFAQSPPETVQLVIRGGTLLPMTGDMPQADAVSAIVIHDGRIQRIIRAGDATPIPAAAQTIDARALFILPGLIDSHVHFRTWFPEIFLHYGVTTLMDTGPCGIDCTEDPNAFILRYKKALNTGQMKGPTLFVTGMKLNGPEGVAEPHSYRLRSVDEVSEKIAFLAGLGVDAIKAEEKLPLEFRRRLVEEATRRGLPVVGHSKDARESISVGMRFIEHMYPIAMSLSGDPRALERGNEYLMDLSRAPELIELMVAKQVYLNPTLVGGFALISDRRRQYADEDARLMTTALFQAVPAEVRARIPKSPLRADDYPAEKRKQLAESYRKVQEFLRAFHVKGGRILAASDATTNSMPGLATHREIQLLVDAGLPPYAALLGATRYAAELMRQQDAIGTVEVGKQADLLVIGADPLADISASQRIRYVIRKGTIERSSPKH
jgi:imidazolonepropionase-like amidohydrolase